MRKKIKHSACSSFRKLTRSIYARDREAVCPWDPLDPTKWEGKVKRDRVMGAGLKEGKKWQLSMEENLLYSL